MPSLFKRSNGVFYVTFTDTKRSPTRKTFSTGETVRRKAAVVARSIEDEIKAGMRLWGAHPNTPHRKAPCPTVRPSQPLVETVAPFLETKRHLSPVTQKDYAYVVRRFVDSLDPGIQAQHVEARHVAQFIEAAGVKPVTRHTYRRHLRVFFRWLVAEGALFSDPTTEVHLERAPSKHPRFLTPNDVERLCQAVREGSPFAKQGAGLWLLPILQTNVYLGLRLGELVNVRWEDIDLERRTLTVRCTDEFMTKSGRERTIPLADVPYQILSCLTRRSEFVFPNHGGEKLYRDQLSRTFKRYVRRVGLPDEIDFHATRHTAASWLVMRGASFEAIRRYLGHSSITVTQRYAHLSNDAFSDQVVSAFARSSS